MSDIKVQKQSDQHVESQILTNADFPINLEGDEYLAKAPTDRDYVELDVWVKAQYLRMVKGAVDLLEPSERSEFMKEAMSTVAHVRWANDLGLSFINSPIGLAKIAFLMLRKNHPRLDEGWLGDAMKKAGNLTEVAKSFSHFNELAESIQESNEGGGSAKK
tara:strand:+ start:8324 stop:8806 length:483 start_codon:yes stop_codon:yes gene_type:complete